MMDSIEVTQSPFGDSDDGSAYASCHRWNFKMEESLTENNASDSSFSENVRGMAEKSKSFTLLEFQAIRHNTDNQSDSSGYLEVRHTTHDDDGYITPLPNENEITIHYNPNGDLVDVHGYLRLLDEKPSKSIPGKPYRVSLPTKKVVVCFPKEKYKSLNNSNIQMRTCIVVLVGLFLVALCAFLLSWFGILQRKDDKCPNPSAFLCPFKYTFSLGENASVNCVLPMFVNYTNLVVYLHKTRVRNQDKRLLQVDDIYKQNPTGTKSGRISTRISGSKDSISIMIDIQGTHCDDHGYISITISGGLVVSIELEVTAPYAHCPKTALFQWNMTELITCSACIGNTTWNVTWYRESKSSYIPVLENSAFFINGSTNRIVSEVELALGVIHFKLLNRQVFCSDGGMYNASLYVEHVEHNFAIKVGVNGFMEACTDLWEIKLIDLTRKTCGLCIGETEDFLNISITQESPDISKSESIQLLQGESKITTFRDYLTIQTNLDAGMVSVLFRWSRVQCIDNGLYRVEVRGRDEIIQRNISIFIDELAFLKVPKIVQQDGYNGGFAEGFNLTLNCTVENIGCKKHEIYLSLPDRNTTAECRNIPLGADNINESYACSLAWTEFNISRDFNGTSFYCGYNYTHFNETTLIFQKEIQVFVIPGNFCEGHAPRCKRPHPLGGRFFIECDTFGDSRPWEVLCQETLVFRHGPGVCEGKCDYP